VKKILIVQGPNLNLLGEREPEIYGSMTLEELNAAISAFARLRNGETIFFQSNHEGGLIDCLHEHRPQGASARKVDGVVINPGALTHYSYALRDAIAAIQLPTVEVHLSDIHKREAFRKISVIKEVCLAQITGLGKDSYLHGIEWLVGHWLTAEFKKYLATKPPIDDAYRTCVKLLKRDFPKYDWAGIYLVEGNDLVLHNFIGAPSPHTRIPIGQGICGVPQRGIAEAQTIIVPDVNADPRYLACSIETKSEIVVPIQAKKIFGEIDIDSHAANAFHSGDRFMLEQIASALADYLTAN
jgi:3-dehydroquinate dehydratase-2